MKLRRWLYDCSRKAKRVESTEHLVQPGTTEKFEDQRGDKKKHAKVYASGKGLKMDVILDYLWIAYTYTSYFDFQERTAMILHLIIGYIRFMFQFLSEYNIHHTYIYTSYIVCQDAHNRFVFLLLMPRGESPSGAGPCRVGGSGGTPSSTTAFEWYRAQLEDLSSEGWSISTTQGAFL